MTHRNAKSAFQTMPSLTANEWHDVQLALRSVQAGRCGHGERPGPLVRGLAKITQFVTHRPAAVATPEMKPICDFLRESARHGPAVDVLAERLHEDGFSDAQIAALSFIAG